MMAAAALFFDVSTDLPLFRLYTPFVAHHILRMYSNLGGILHTCAMLGASKGPITCVSVE